MFLIPLLLSLSLCFILFVLLKRIHVLPNQSDLFLYSLSYLFFFGIVSLQLFAYNLFSFPWTVYTLLTPWFLLGMTLFFSVSKKTLFHFEKEKISKISMLLLSLIVLLLFFVGFESVLRPVSSWDSWSNWLLKAKMFFIDGAIAPMFAYTRSDYPIGISLFVAFFYFVLGGIDDTSVLILFFLFYAFLGLAFYSFTRRFVSFEIALLFTFLLLSTQNIIRHGGRYETGMADLALGYGILCAVMLFFEFLHFKHIGTLVLLELVVVICGFFKYEGIVFSFLMQLLLITIFIRDRKVRLLPYLMIWVAPSVGWYLYKMHGGVQQHYIFFGSGIQLSRVPVILNGMIKEFVNIKNWNILWPVFFLTSFVYRKSISQELWYMYILLLLQLASYLVVFVVTPVDFEAQIFITIDRLYLHLSPAVVWITAMVVGPAFTKLQFNKAQVN